MTQIQRPVNIGAATQLWGSEILRNLQQYMNKYRQQYKSAQGGWYVVQPLGSVEIGLRGCRIWGNTLYVYGIENV